MDELHGTDGTEDRVAAELGLIERRVRGEEPVADGEVIEESRPESGGQFEDDFTADGQLDIENPARPADRRDRSGGRRGAEPDRLRLGVRPSEGCAWIPVDPLADGLGDVGLGRQPPEITGRPPIPPARAAGSSRFAEIRSAVAFTRAATSSATAS
jgi:hypothetical protein